MFNCQKKKFKQQLRMLFFTLFYLTASGCVSTVRGPTLMVGNATDSIISRAVLITESGQNYSFNNIVPYSVSGGTSRTTPLSSDMRVEWQCIGGISNSSTLNISEDILDFNGWIQFQIDSSGAVKVFTAPMEDSGNSVLPWSMPASWEGAPSIPGMNM